VKSWHDTQKIATYNVQSRDCIIISDMFGDLQAAASANMPVRVLVETAHGLGIMNSWRVSREDEEGMVL